MANLSSLQVATLDAFREANPGPIGVILEDNQGYAALVRHITGAAVQERDNLAKLADRKVALCVNGGGNGPPEDVNLREVVQSYPWCFILFQATFGRDDIAVQIDRLLDAGRPLDRLFLVNYHLDHTEAKDDLRRLFALVATVELCFADGQHLFEVDAENTANPRGARHVANLFAHMRKVGLPALATSYREYRRCVEELGAAHRPGDVVKAARHCLTAATGMLFRLNLTGLPSKRDFDRATEIAIAAYLADAADGSIGEAR